MCMSEDVIVKGCVCVCVSVCVCMRVCMNVFACVYVYDVTLLQY